MDCMTFWFPSRPQVGKLLQSGQTVNLFGLWALGSLLSRLNCHCGTEPTIYGTHQQGCAPARLGEWNLTCRL